MILGLTAQGFIQGAMLDNGADFVDSVKEMQPWWTARTIVGTIMDVALGFMAYNFYKTAREGPAVNSEDREPLPTVTQPIAMTPTKNWLESPSTIGIVAGVVFFVGSFFILGGLPWLQAATRTTTVADAVTGLSLEVNRYSPLEERGRQVYIRDGCWQCHSQYIRPVTGESLRWGPVSQVGEYAYDRPHMFSTRRIGPDLARVGRKYGDDWHIAHLWDPQAVVADSIMPRFTWLFEKTEGDNPPQLTEDGKALVAYLQRLGTSIGDWRAKQVFVGFSGAAPLPGNSNARTELLSLGKAVYERRCSGCHGDKGNGQGPSAKFLDPKPRDFTTGLFKFRSTTGKDPLPTDADLYLTVSHGLWGTSMPSMKEISDQRRWAVIQYVKTFSDRWTKEPGGHPVVVPSEPPVTPASIKQGHTLFQSNCALCHGDAGKGDGVLSQPGMLVDDWGHPVKPANLTLPAGASGGAKLGHDSPHLFRIIMAGIGGTPMPPFDGLQAEEVWDLVHYVQSLRAEAHEAGLVAAGIKEDERPIAKERIWAAMSADGAALQSVTTAEPYKASAGMAAREH
jgi:cbb3-type cytochrome oxidase cytochrome c subunit/cytochrome c553